MAERNLVVWKSGKKSVVVRAWWNSEAQEWKRYHYCYYFYIGNKAVHNIDAATLSRSFKDDYEKYTRTIISRQKSSLKNKIARLTNDLEKATELLYQLNNSI